MMITMMTMMMIITTLMNNYDINDDDYAVISEACNSLSSAADWSLALKQNKFFVFRRTSLKSTITKFQMF